MNNPESKDRFMFRVKEKSKNLTADPYPKNVQFWGILRKFPFSYLSSRNALKCLYKLPV